MPNSCLPSFWAHTYENSIQLSESWSTTKTVLKRQCVMDHKNTFSNVEIFFLFSIFNICEKLFSTAGYALIIRQRRILPISLNSKIFLFLTQRFWGHSEGQEGISQFKWKPECLRDYTTLRRPVTTALYLLFMLWNICKMKNFPVWSFIVLNCQFFKASAAEK